MKISNITSRTRFGVSAALIAVSLALSAAPVSAQQEPRQRFKDWALACEKPPGNEQEQAAEQCYIFQNISVKETKKRLLHLAIGYVGGKGQPAAVITLPLGIFLPPGVSFKVDEGKPIKVSIQTCIPAGCRAVLPLEDAAVASMKRGKQGQIGFFDGNRREIGIPVSLLGFTAGFAALTQ